MSKLFNSVVVCTKDRCEDIQKFLYSLVHQTRRPDELLIIDASQTEKNIELVAKKIALGHIESVKYYKTKPNLAYQKNFSLLKLDKKCDIVSFFDDDVILDQDYISSTLKIFEDIEYSDVVGASGKISNAKDIRMKFLKKIFFLYSLQKGKILPSGFNVRNLDSLNEKVFIEWMPGGISSYRRDVFKEFRFDEQYSRNGAGREDIDFSYRVSRQNKLLFTPEATLEHKESDISRVSERQLGRIQVAERYYFVKKNMHRLVNKMAFYWSVLGVMSINLLSGFLTPKSLKDRIQRLRGNIDGLAFWIQEHKKDFNTAEKYSFLWSRYEHVEPPEKYHFDLMQEVISDRIVRGSVGVDLGCGPGWDTFNMARKYPLVRIIGMDISGGVYKTSSITRDLKNAVTIKASASSIPLKGEVCDFVYSFGVLHHMGDYRKGFSEISRVLKKNSPAFLYLYEDHYGDPLKYIAVKISTALRRITVRIPSRGLYILSCAASPLMVLLFSYPAKIFRRYKLTYKLYEKMPFNFGSSPFSLRGDLYDRFSAPTEMRFNQKSLYKILAECNFANVQITKLKATAGWVVWGYKK